MRFFFPSRPSSIQILTAMLLVGTGLLSAYANEKAGMPDLSQVDQTCLPTSTANLILWFGRHGYPKLIAAGANQDERELRTVHGIMTDTAARFDWGTRRDKVSDGVEKYIRDAGYSCEVEYRGLDGKGPAFTQDWLKENNDANRGFILFLAYCHWNAQARTATPVWAVGHAVTLVNAEPNLLLIHDPDHENDQTGRKILTPEAITDGTWRDSDGSQSANGLLFISGSLLEAPPESNVLITGAICITMHPLEDVPSMHAEPTARTNATLGGKAASLPAAPVSWWSTLFRMFLDN